MKWEESFNTGVHQFDDDHKYLMAQLLKVKQRLESNELKEVKEVLIPEIIAFTKEHFKNEELMMKEVNYPDIDGHTQLHNSFLDQIDNLGDHIEKITVENLDILFKPMYNFIIKWMMDHILLDDEKLAKFCLEHKENCNESCV